MSNRLGRQQQIWVLTLLTLLVASIPQIAETADPPANATGKVSYHREVLPILQANCQGCHQPARAQGGYVMTEMAKLLKGGETGDIAVVPGKPDESELIRQVTPVDGKAEMPKGKPPLSAGDLDVLRRWVEQGAVDDSPAEPGPQFSQDKPPVYAQPPVITSIDFAPDASLIAVAGFHEVLLVDSQNWQTVGRLVGLSERIESVRFSPDGTRLLVTADVPVAWVRLKFGMWPIASCN